MPFNARCWKPQQIGLVIATLFLSGCASLIFDTPSGVCPPVVDYSRAEQARVADEVEALSADAELVGWLSDYAVMRDQARACR